MRVAAQADLCAAHAPFVYGGKADEWTVIAPGAWRGTEWPCPGRVPADALAEPGAVDVAIVCTCPCHVGQLEHELPPHARRTAVHPTEVPRGG